MQLAIASKRISICVSLLLLLSISPSLSAQIAREEMLPLFTQLEEKDYKEAHKTAKAILIRFKNDSSFLMGIVRYGYLYSGAALIADRKLSYEEFRPSALALEGKLIQMPAHPTSTDTSRVIWNVNVLSNTESGGFGKTTTTNETGTSIYAFEEFLFPRPLKLELLNNRITSCGGVLKKIEFNPTESTIWIMKLYVEDAILEVN